MLSIGRMARLLGITTKTIKHYEEIGLLHPAFVNPENGYRYYEYAQQLRLQQICMLRSFGISLIEIREMDKLGIEHLLKERITSIDAEIIRLEETKLNIINHLQKGENKMKVRFEIIEPIKVIGFEHAGSVQDIPFVWEKLNKENNNLKQPAEQSFGVCLAGDRKSIQYVAAYEATIFDRKDLKEVFIEGGSYVVAKVEGGIPNIPATFDFIAQMTDIEFREAPDFERYIHPVGSTEDEIEIWVPIK